MDNVLCIPEHARVSGPLSGSGRVNILTEVGFGSGSGFLLGFRGQVRGSTTQPRPDPLPSLEVIGQSMTLCILLMQIVHQIMQYLTTRKVQAMSQDNHGGTFKKFKYGN
jgi:hypothetical protein